MSNNNNFKEIKGHLRSIGKILKEGDFLDSCIDKLKITMLEFKAGSYDKSKIYNIPDTHGIYMFWADFSSFKKESVNPLQDLLNEFSGVWNKKNNWCICQEVQECGKFPPANGTRRSKLFANNAQVDIKAIPFYIGRSKKLKTRIEEHCIFDGSKSTSALKLNYRADFLKDIKFKVAWLTLDVSDEEYFVVDKIEALLRDKLNPIIGKQ